MSNGRFHCFYFFQLSRHKEEKLSVQTRWVNSFYVQLAHRIFEASDTQILKTQREIPQSLPPPTNGGPGDGRSLGPWSTTRNIAATYRENPSGLRSKLYLSCVLSHWKMKVYFFKQQRLTNTLLRSLKLLWLCHTHPWQYLRPPSRQLCPQYVR